MIRVYTDKRIREMLESAEGTGRTKALRDFEASEYAKRCAFVAILRERFIKCPTEVDAQVIVGADRRL